MNYTTNEWGKLKKVIVGIANNAQIPTDIDISLRCVNFADEIDESNIQTGPYPQQVIDEANEDLEMFVNFLNGESVEVYRPDVTDCNYYNYCPRDSVFVHNKLALATPMPIQARKDEWRAFEKHLQNVLNVPCTYKKNLYNTRCIGNKDILALNESEPAFDAANVIRANEDILYLVSNSGNKQGAKLLQNILGNDCKIHLLKDVYSYMHIDSTVAFLREGLLLANPSRIKSKDNLPEPFRSWDIIWCPEPVDIGHYPDWCNASTWINMNLFSVNTKLVALEENQEPLRKVLEQYNIECAMLPMRHQRTLGGGFHCVTLDIERDVD
jgi:N-dimethylarginine dimethylaminohydrolase